MQLHLQEQCYAFPKRVDSDQGYMELEKEQNFFEWWSRNLKPEFRFNRHTLHRKPIVLIMQCFSVFNRPNRSRTGAIIFKRLEPELKNWMLGAGTGTRNLSFGSIVPVICPSHFCRIRVASPSSQSYLKFFRVESVSESWLGRVESQ